MASKTTTLSVDDRKTVIYVLDKFMEIDASPDEVFELMKKDPMKLFRGIRGEIEKLFGKYSNVEVYMVYTGRDEGLVEYMVSGDWGK